MTNRKMRIILDCDLMRYRDSGLYHYCLNLGKQVSLLLDKPSGEDMRFYIPAPEKQVFPDPEKCIAEKKWHHRFFNPCLRQCDIWHAPFQSGRILPKPNPRLKILLTIHDLNCLHEDKSAKERRQSLQHTQSLIDRSDAIVCISHHCKKDVVTQLDTGNKPVYVIHNGTHYVNTPPDQPAGYRPSKPFGFAMGYVNRKKNFHTLVPLLEQQELEIIIAGRLDEPDYILQMKQQAAELGVEDRLKILGPVSEADKAWYFKNCEAFLMPSLAEGFGAPVVEAMQFGKPVFLSHLTSLPEVGGDVSFYFRNFNPDHMREVFSHGMAEYRKNGLDQKIRLRGEAFKWEDKAREYLSVYRSLIK